MPPEIGEKGKEHSVARQSEAARHIEEEEECENAHPHIHGQECPLRRRQPVRFQEQHGQQETDEHAHEITEDEILELFDRRQVDPAHPDQQQLREKDMGEQFQLEGERLVPEENHRRNRPEYKENRTHAEHGRRHVAIVLHRDAVREIACQDNRKT